MPGRVSETFAGTYMTASEFLPLGQRRTAVIHAAAEELVGPDKKKVAVVDLVSPKGLAWGKRVVLNKTNALLLAATFGDEYDAWLGRSITIWADHVLYQGRMVPGVKVQPIANGDATAAPPPPPAMNMGGAAAPIPSDGPAGKVYAGPGSDFDDDIPFG